MEKSALRRSWAHKCLVVFTSALLLCEVVVGRLCKSLINTVDSFHTLSVLVRMILHPSLIRTRACCSSTPGAYACPDERALQCLPSADPVPSPPTAVAADAGSGGAAPDGVRYSALRVQPFGALVSALLLACLCISFILEILSHTLQPQPIKRPLLATVAGAASLLFNALILVWRRGKEANVGSDVSGNSLTGIQYENYQTTKKQALSVISRRPTSGRCGPETSRTGQQWQDVVRDSVAIIQSLLASVLVLVNGLVPLFLDPSCQPPHWGCSLLTYLDPGFSMLTVLVFLAATLPELRRYGLVLLQACPPHVNAQELSVHVSRLPGVLAVHELHVWQLCEAQLVVSVHVHCPSGLEGPAYAGLLADITEVLGGFGLRHCTVQLEFLKSTTSCGQSAKTGEVDPCSLHCGKKCGKMMCCSPPRERACSTAPSSVDKEVKHRDVVEDTHL